MLLSISTQLCEDEDDVVDGGDSDTSTKVQINYDVFNFPQNLNERQQSRW